MGKIRSVRKLKEVEYTVYSLQYTVTAVLKAVTSRSCRLTVKNFKCIHKVSKINPADKMSVFPKLGVEFLIKPTTKPRYTILMCEHYSSVLLLVQAVVFAETRTAGTQTF